MYLNLEKEKFKKNKKRGKTNETKMCVGITFCSYGNDNVCRMWKQQGSGGR